MHSSLRLPGTPRRGCFGRRHLRRARANCQTHIAGGRMTIARQAPARECDARQPCDESRRTTCTNETLSSKPHYVVDSVDQLRQDF